MPGWLLENPVALVAGIAAIWFFMRFIVAPKRGAPGLAGMFQRERPVKPAGMGLAAITTLIEATKRFAAAEPGLRGLILAGPFAARTAQPTSVITFIVMAEDPSAYADRGWIARWPYPASGHPIIAEKARDEAGIVSHELTLRGSPPIAFHFIGLDAPEMPPALVPVLREGTETLDDPSGIAEKRRRHWLDEINKTQQTPK